MTDRINYLPRLTSITVPILNTFVASVRLAERIVNDPDDVNTVLDLITSQKLQKYSMSVFGDFYFTPKLSDMLLSADAIRSLTVQNAGGKSALSEMLSIHYFGRLYDATEVLLEKEVEYWINYKMVDFICTVRNKRVGVSVTRAMGFPSSDRFGYQDAVRLLHKKLYGLIVSRKGVSKKHKFNVSVLHVWCQTAKIAKLVSMAYENFDLDDYGLDVKNHVILLLTVYKNPEIYHLDKHSLV